LVKNPLMKTVKFGFLITAIGISMIFGPGFVGIDGFDGGYAISLTGLFVTILGLLVIGFYYQEAKILDNILRGEGLLVHWTFDNQIWQQYTQKEYVEEINEKKGLFLIVTAFALFFGFLFWFLDNEAGFVVFLLMLGLIGLVGFTWRFSAWYIRKQNIEGVKEAYIARTGVYMNQRLYTWRFFSAKLLKVEIKKEKASSVLKFSYTAFSFPGPQTYAVRVPIPIGQEETAKNIVVQLNP
jgi:hypothetical protein